MGKTVPGNIAASLAVLETMGKVSEADQISCDSWWISTVNSWTTQLEKGAPPRVQAQRTPVAILIAVELVVCDDTFPRHLRAILWVYLVMHWAVLRADDTQGIDPSRISLTEICLRGVLVRTKTTGPGKRVTEVPF